MQNHVDFNIKQSKPEPLSEKGAHYYALKNELQQRAQYKKSKRTLFLSGFFTKFSFSAALVLLVYVGLFGFFDTDFAKGERLKKVINSAVVPQEIDEQIMYPSRFATPDVTFFESAEWTTISVSDEWVNKGYYYEIWNGFNKPLTQYTAQRLNASEIDISDVNAEDYGTLRFVLFVPEGETFDQKEVVQNVFFHWQKSLNYRLVGMMVMVFVILSVVTISAFIEKVTDKNILMVLRGVFIGRETKEFIVTVFEKENQKKVAVALSLLIMVLGGIFGAAVGSFMGNIHVISVLIKFPILILGTYVISSVLWYLLSTRMSSGVTMIESVITVLLFLARFSLILVSMIPVVLFFIYSGVNHDGILLLLLFLLTLSLLIASGYLYRVYAIVHQEKPSIPLVSAWVFLYAIIGLQLSWMLRPWVGLVGEYDQYIPFMRLYSGNVFEEIIILIIRIITGNSL
jgi:hypothetical protein